MPHGRGRTPAYPINSISGPTRFDIKQTCRYRHVFRSGRLTPHSPWPSAAPAARRVGLHSAGVTTEHTAPPLPDDLSTPRSTMHRRLLLSRLAVTGAPMALTLALYAPKARGARQLRLGHQFAPDSIPDRVAQRFASQVAQVSAGALQVQVYPGGTFGDERAHLSLLRRGALDFSVTGDLIISSLDPAFLVVNMPFLYRDTAHALAAYSGPQGTAMREQMLQSGVLALSWHHVGMRVLTAHRPVRSIDDLQGLKLRLPPDAAWMAVWTALGASPVQIPFTDLPSALKLGKVHAQENPPNFVRAGKLHEHQKYLMRTNHMPQRQFLFASTSRWNTLSTSEQRVLHDAAREASRWAVTTAQQEDARDLAWLVGEAGMTSVAFDPAGINERLDAVARSLGGPSGLKAFEAIRALR